MILGIAGSPRKGKLTDQLVTQAMSGAESAGSEVVKIYLVEYEIPPYGKGKHSCPQEINELCKEADAIVIGAPVYWGDINGLTKDFMDTVEIPNANGKWGIGITVAGGSGKGLLVAVHSIYSFFYHRQIRGIDPTPVSRFNFQQALLNLEQSGRKIAELSKRPRPFSDLWDRIEHYEGLEYMRPTFLDEMLLLGSQLISISGDKPGLQTAKAEHEKAESLCLEGRRTEAARHAVAAYDALFY